MKKLATMALTISAVTCSVQANQTDVRISLDDAANYNAFIFSDFTAPSSKVEGRLAVGGDLDIDGYSIADTLPSDDDAYSLVVGGNAKFPTGRIYAGHVLVSGSAEEVGNAVRFGLGADQLLWDQIDVPINFVSAKEKLMRTSLELTQLATNGLVEAKWGGLYLLGDCESNLQVFNIDGAALQGAHTFDVSCIPEGAHVVFNISGVSTGLKNVSLSSLTTHRNRVLFNFHEANDLGLTGVYVEGSILAPLASVSSPSGTINGTLVAKQWNGTMSFSNQKFIPYRPDYKACEGPNILLQL